MIVIGAKGHAKEVLEVLVQNGNSNNICLFDNVSKSLPLKMYDVFPIITSLDIAKKNLEINSSFVSAIGNPKLRFEIVQKFKSLGGDYKSVVSQSAQISSFDVIIAKGCNIMSNVFISNSVSIGEGCLINQGASIHHDTEVGNYCDVSPKATLLGRVKVGKFVSIGTGAIILPDITLADNVVIGAGSVVTKDVAKGKVVYGIPAKSK